MGGKELIVKKEKEKHGGLTFQTLLSEAMSSACGLGDPWCSVHWLCWETQATPRPPCEEQASGREGLGVGMAKSYVHELFREGTDRCVVGVLCPLCPWVDLF